MVRRRILFAPALLATLASGWSAVPAAACSVCFGDPESQLTQGAVKGMIVLLGAIGFVLASIAFIGGVWIVRARQLERGGANNSRAQ